jgi:outer membrane protein assembly factor BamB
MKRKQWWAVLFIVGLLAGCAEVTITPGSKPTADVPIGKPGQPAGSQPLMPMFGGSPYRNMVNLTDKNPPVSWDVEEGKQKNIKWVAPIGKYSFGGPVVADGKVFVGTNNDNPRDPKIKERDKAVLMAFNEADGKFLWQIVHDLPDIVPEIARIYGLCSTPVVEDKRLYYVTPGCEVVCADVAGKVVWTLDMNKELKVLPHHLANCSPLVVGDLVMVITGNGLDTEYKPQNPKAPSFIAVNKKTGRVAWQSNLPGDRVIEGQFSNPTLAQVNGKPQVIFAGGDCVVYSFEPTTGDLIWKCVCPRVGKPSSTRGIDNHIIATPVVVGDRLYVGLGIAPETGNSTKFGYFLCLDITKKGDVSFKNFDPKSPANKDSALVWAYGGLVEPRPEKGRDAYFGSTMSTAAIHDGLVYIAEERGYLHCLDQKTGKRYWYHDFLNPIWGSPYWVDGKIYVVTEEGNAFVFLHGKERKYYYQGKPHAPTADDDKKLQPGIPMEEYVQSTPVVASGVLYIMTRRKLYAIATGK